MNSARPTMTPLDLRKLTIPEMLDYLAEHGDPADPRPDIDTESLRRRFPHLAPVRTTDVTIAGPGGRSLPARTYVHPGLPSTTGLVWAHGGAFVGGNLDMPEANWTALELAASGIPVLSIDYTKCIAGVHYPIPSDDVIAAWRFAADGSEHLLGVSPAHLYLGGGSAGATLTASATRRLSHGGEPGPAGLVLVYPALYPDTAEPERVIMADDAERLGLSFNYAGSLAAMGDPDVFPGLGDPTGFPPTLVIACELDGMRASAEHFANTLRTAGVVAEFRVEPGADHGHLNDPGDSGAERTIEAIVAWMGGRP